MKLIDSRNVSKKLSPYHKIIKYWYKRQTIKTFNKMIENSIRENRKKLYADNFAPTYANLNGLYKRAANEGIAEAVAVIESKYQKVCSYYGGGYWEHVADKNGTSR